MLFLHSQQTLNALKSTVRVIIQYKQPTITKIQPIWEAKQKYGGRIALLGGIDVNILASASEEETRRHVRFVLEQCAGQGYALGSGNSIADYVKLGNYLAMLDEGRKFRQ